MDGWIDNGCIEVLSVMLFLGCDQYDERDGSNSEMENTSKNFGKVITHCNINRLRLILSLD